MKMLKVFILGIGIASFAATLTAQTEQVVVTRDDASIYAIRFRDAPIDAVLHILQKMTGKDITVDLGVRVTITLSTTDKVTAEEGTALITQALAAQGVRLENLDEKTIRVRGTPKSETTTVHYESREAAMKGIAELKAQRQSGQQSEPIATTDFSYADRRRARMAAGDTNSIEPCISEADLQRHLADYQQAISNQGLQALPDTTGAENW